MNDLKEPVFVTFRLEATGDGLHADIRNRGCDYLQFSFGSNKSRWMLWQRTSDGKSALLDQADGHRYIAGLDPTWLGAYRALRNPVLKTSAQICEPLMGPVAPPTPQPAGPSAGAGPALKTIGTVVALGPGIYTVEDRGSAACPNGTPGHALHLRSRTNDRRQQLSDVIIDLQSMRFCTIRFGMRAGFGLGADAIVEQHYADVGGYWVQTDGLLEATARVAGIAAGHGVWRYRLLDMQFPDALPPEVFKASDSVMAAAFDAAPYLRPQRLVDIGGRRLNVYCSGRGSPTVVLEAGGGDDMLDWRYVQPLLAKRVRVCSYDRAGSGFSDPGPFPRDASAIVGDLHALLARAGIAPPFVLAGYSDGELFARLYADRYLNDLAGLVLIEPAYEGDQEARVAVAVPKIAVDARRATAAAKACAAATERQELQPRTALYDACVAQADPQLPDALNAVVAQQWQRPGWWRTYVSANIDAAHATVEQISSEQRAYGNLPLVVMTTKNVFAPGYLTPAEQQTVSTILEDGRAAIAGYSTNGSRVAADTCTHSDITTRCADNVVSAIASVIDQGRAGSRP